MRRATEDHVVKAKEGVALEGAALTTFLLNVQEYDQIAAKLLRRLRERALVDLLASSDLEKKADFEDKKALEKLLKAIEKAKIKMEAKIVYDEEHSLHELVLGNGSGPFGAHQLGAGFHARVKRLRTLSRAISASG